MGCESKTPSACGKALFLLPMRNQPRLLYTVLNWGLGHATRSMPVIEALLASGAEVILAGEGDSLKLLADTFPLLPAEEVKGINISYPVSESLAVAMVKQAPAILRAIRSEQEQFENLVSKYLPDALISDNRYGAYSSRIPSVLLCHQLRLKTPLKNSLAEEVLFRLYKPLLKPFQQYWVPDAEGADNLTGDLSHHATAVTSLRPQYMGVISRMANVPTADIPNRYDILVIISGPEPQRSAFESSVKAQLIGRPESVLIVQGQPQLSVHLQEGNITSCSHLPAAELKHHLLTAGTIISRSGHSTLMDLCAVQRSAICIPTPGQTEQEYLAEMHAEKGRIITQSQQQMDLGKALSLTAGLKPFQLPVNEGIKATIDSFLSGLQ